VRDDCDVPVHVRAEIDLHRLTLLDHRVVVRRGGVVADLVVHADARRERDAFIDLLAVGALFVVKLRRLFLD
jgi:hypothetical protein